MMREPTPEQHKAALQAQLRAGRGHLPDFPSGPVVEQFCALQLAQAIERELERAASSGQTKLRIDMALIDAQALASCLRRAVLSGAG